MSNETNPNGNSNLSLIHEYTKWVFDSISSSANIINGKFTTVIGFSGILLRFASDLPNCNVYFSFAKIGICIFLVLAIIFSAFGIAPHERGAIVSPEELRKDYYYGLDEECRRYTTDNLIEAVEQLRQYRNSKASYLFWAVICLATATVIFGTDIALSFICLDK
ncbi:hypothetical protein C7H19_23730 [Aphanothece hegewaldii CCALA 016]|uniref:Uncharacterized protein n=1 Tax=Aphanothece hegewaldii CCALA 016 TaxID=2107694 RepID=A0A2T1LR34_9CHRO|nr:hypothetical protein [Aphanothece hegewaldii]PSF30525.1 hypothetical protein C7H19_23730 [Aphanothece hegewaldii CCALA 016]